MNPDLLLLNRPHRQTYLTQFYAALINVSSFFTPLHAKTLKQFKVLMIERRSCPDVGCPPSWATY